MVTGPSHGSLSGTPPDVTHTSDDTHSGSDSFTFKVNDGEADSVPATVSIQILPAATSLRTTDCTGIYGGNVQLRQYDLKRTTDDTALSGRTVAYRVDGTQVGTAVTDSAGNSTLNWGINGGPVSRAVTVEFAGEAAYGPSSAAATLTVQAASPYIWVAPRSVNVGSPAGLYAYFRTVPGYVPQAGKTVTFRMDGTAVGTSVTDDGGVARHSYDTHGMSMGDHTVRCEFGGEALISSGFGEGMLTVLPARPYIWVAERSVNAGSMASLYAYFRTLPDRTPQAGKTLTFKIDGTAVGSKTTDSSGVARYPYDTHGMAMGSHTILCEFGGDTEVAAGYGEAPLTILGAQPYIWVAQRTVSAGSMAPLYAYFRILPDLISQPDKAVTFKIDGTAVGSKTTDSSGVARFSYDTHGLSMANHTIRCEFGGDAQVAAGYGEAPLMVLPARPYIWVADRTVKAGSTTELYAYFRTLPDLIPQPGKTVKFKLDGSLVRTVVTDSSGVARYGFDTHGKTPGVHTIRCEFAGDAEVAAGYGDGTLTIN
jgi:hypothetical protein